MADELTKVVSVQVNTSEAVKRIAELRGEQEKLAVSNSDLAEARAKGIISEKDYNLAIAKNKEASKAYGKEINSLSHEVQKNIQENKAQEGSLVSLRGQLSNLNKEYDNLSRTEREGAKGQELLDKINKVTDEVKKAEEATGRFQRNVGNYKGGIIDAFGAMGGAGGKLGSSIKKGSETAKKGLDLLKGHPVMLFFMLLINVLNAVGNALSSSEENANRLQAGFANLKGITIIFQKALQALGKGLAWLAEKLGDLADRWGLVTEEMKANQQITKDEIALQKEMRRVKVENSDLELQASEARAKAAEKDKYTAEERLNFMLQAAAAEKKISENSKATAEEELRILQEKAKLSENSAEFNDQIAEAQVKVNQATINYYNAMRRINAQVASFRSEIEKENEALEENARLLAAYDEAFWKRLDDMSAELDAMAMEWAQSLNLRKDISDGFIEVIEEEVAEERSATEDYKKLLEEQANAYRARTDSFLKGAEYTSQAIGNTIAALDKLGEDNKAAAAMSKVLTIAQITLDGARSVAAMLASAFNPADPSPLFVKIATSVSAAAMIASTIGAAIQTAKGVKLAEGGLVRGAGTGTSDSIPARLSNGESVMNARTTSMFSPLLSALNQAGGGASFSGANGQQGFDFLAEAVAQGMRQADIRVGVDEITRTNDRVAQIKAIASL